MSADPSVTGGAAEILDRGYRRYDGPRSGVAGAIGSVARQTAMRALGMRRSIGHKVLPAITIFFAYVPAIVFVGISALLDTEELRMTGEFVLPTYGEYYGYIIAAIFLFTALVAPEVLCTDRRSGMLGLYLASPLTRDTYLVAKAAAVTGVLAVVTIGPPLLMLIARTLDGTGPEGFSGFLDLLGKVLLSGVVVTVLYTSISLAVSSFTTRRAFASAAVILIFGVSAFVDGTITEGGVPPEWFVLNVAALPIELVFRIYGDVASNPASMGAQTGVLVAGYLAWTFLALGILRARYQRATVTR